MPKSNEKLWKSDESWSHSTPFSSKSINISLPNEEEKS